LLLTCAMFLRRLVSWYGRRISVVSMTPWEQLRHAAMELFCPADATHPGEKSPSNIAL